MLHGNSQLLVDTLESLTLFENRYSGLRLVNVPASGPKRGFFSLIFRAKDELSGKDVALKFFDLDPAKGDLYRIKSFEREHEILTRLIGAPRCLQVLSNFSTYHLQATVSNGIVVTLPANYFAVDWLEDDIDDYFQNQGTKAAIEKLRIFNEVVLAVESLHSRGIFHRDLKADNFRAQQRRDGREVVAIDLGTAARHDSAPMASSYGGPVGMLMYSAPEAFCGLSGAREVAPLSDVFALGCMLFELFHHDDFPAAFRLVNSDFDVRFAALQSKVGSELSEPAKLAAWSREAPRLLHGLSQVALNGSGSSAPTCIADILTSLVGRMTVPDFQQRTLSFKRIRELSWTAIRILQNQKLAQQKAKQAADRRSARAAKAAARAQRAIGSRNLNSARV